MVSLELLVSPIPPPKPVVTLPVKTQSSIVATGPPGPPTNSPPPLPEVFAPVIVIPLSATEVVAELNTPAIVVTAELSFTVSTDDPLPTIDNGEVICGSGVAIRIVCGVLKSDENPIVSSPGPGVEFESMIACRNDPAPVSATVDTM